MDPEPFDPAAIVEMASSASWVTRVLCFRTIDSTNAEAVRRAAAGEPAGLVVVADAQTAGRGRLGRAWQTEPGKAMLTSWLVRPTLRPDRRPLLSLVTGVAAARALASAAGLDVRLKWPNDLLVGRRKIGGILAESDGGGAVVIGLGVNVRQTQFPEEIAGSATSVAVEGGRIPERAWLLAATLSGFGSRMDSPGDALDDYRALCDTIGRPVRVEMAGGLPVHGTAKGVNDAGALIVQPPGGTPLIVPAGDVVHLRD